MRSGAGEIRNLPRKSAMIPVAHIEHHLPGRVRLRVPSKRGEAPFFEMVVKELSKHPAIWELVASPLTGSITLEYSEPLQAIIDAALDLTLFETGQPKPHVKGGESKQSERLGRDASLAGSVAAGLSGLSAYQAVQGNIAGNAVESFWLSFNTQMTLGRPDLAALFAALGVWQILRGQFLGSASSLFFYSMVMRQVATVEEARARSRPVVSRKVKAAK
jgi:hypothetical protein